MAFGISHEEIEEIFSFHPPRSDHEVSAHEQIRAVCRQAAHAIKNATPDSAEQTLALRHIQGAMTMANAAVAIHGARN